MMATKMGPKMVKMGWGFGIALVLLFLAQGIFIFNAGDNISLALAQAPQTEAETASGQPGTQESPLGPSPPAPAKTPAKTSEDPASASTPSQTGSQSAQPLPAPQKEKEPSRKKTADTAEVKREGNHITINFNNIELQAFTKFISDLTKRNFIIDDKVQGKVTIVSPTRISKEEAYQMFLSVLELKGFTAVETDNVTKIIPSSQVRQSGIKVISDKEMDIKGEGFLTKIFHLNYVSPAELTKTIQPMISKDGNVISYSPTNALIITDSFSNIKKLTDVIRVLDVEPPKGKGQINVYYLRNANAEDIAKVLTGIVSKTQGQPGAAPAAGMGRPSFESGVLVTPDKATNALVITASPQDYETLKDVISQLDIRRRQVYVEAAIMEISLDKQRELGIEFRSVEGLNNNRVTSFGGTNFGGMGAATTGVEGFANILGLAVGIIKGTFTFRGIEYLNIGALVRALQSETDVNILSTPNILTMDNQKAEIMVGENVPFITGKSQGAGGVTLTTIERKDIGITLRLTPQISSDDHVSLEIYQEISALAEAAGFDPNVVGPITTKRAASTTVIVKNAQTVAIAGLIRDNKSTIEHKVPLLGDIPLLGWLFKFQTKKAEKTNLMIFLTPHIIKESEDADAILKEKKEKMEEFKKEHGMADKNKEEAKKE
ncbi:MAG: type II secretion system secretin GspD [Nitrospirota bacterium]